MLSNKHLIYNWVFVDEGGYTDDPDDDLGTTTWGITIGEVKQWRKKSVTKQDMREFQQDEAAAIYDAWYWNPLRCNDLPTGIDYMVFDAGLMSGIARGAKWLQLALGVTADGQIGPKTIGAAAVADIMPTVQKIFDLRVRRATTHHDAWKYKRGWINRFTRVKTRIERNLIVKQPV